LIDHLNKYELKSYSTIEIILNILQHKSRRNDTFVIVMRPVFILCLIIISFNSQGQNLYDTTSTIKNIEILDSGIDKYRVFVTGENHSKYVINGTIEYQFLKHLHKNSGVRNLIIELGFSRGYMLNAFINEDSLAIDLLKGNTSNIYIEFYYLLRNFNQSLPESERIHVYGVDVERFLDDGPILLNRLLQNGNLLPKDLEFSVEVLKSYAKYIQKKYKNLYETDADYRNGPSNMYLGYNGFNDKVVLDSILFDYESKKDVFNQFLGSDSTVYNQVINSLKEYQLYMSYYRMPHQFIYRERKIFENICQLLRNEPKAKFYGQFGRCHIGMNENMNSCNWWDAKSFTKRFEYSEFKGQILNAAIIYGVNSVFSDWDIEIASDTLNQELKTYQNKAEVNENSLFKVSNTDSLLKTYYNYIIVSRSNQYVYERPNTKVGNTAFINLAFGQSNYNFDVLNQSVFSSAKGFNSNFKTVSIGVSTNTFGFYMDHNFTLLMGQDMRVDKYSQKLSGYSITQGYGFAPRISNNFAIATYFLMGYSKLNLKINNDTLQPIFSPGFSKVKEINYSNSAFVVGLGADIRIALNDWFGVFARGQFMFDPSNKYWKQKNGIVGLKDSNSPKTSLRNYSLNAGISFLIQDL
jgi:hypothetical protein